MKVNRCEIWWYSFPAPDHRRPVLVLTRQEILPHLAQVTVAPITTTIREIPTEVLVGSECGLEQRSAINLDNLATVPVAGLRARLGRASPQVMEQVQEALMFALGFEER